MTDRKSKLKTIREVKLHDHTCLMFNSNKEFFHCAIPFIREGLKNNEKCYIVIDEIRKEEVLRNFNSIFREGHIPPDELTGNGRITVKSFKEVYLIDGLFDIERTINNYVKITKKHISQGYTGVRVIAEIAGSLKRLMNPDAFLNYEAKVDSYFAFNNFLAICAYNKKYFSNEYILNIKKIHSVEIDLINTRL